MIGTCDNCGKHDVPVQHFPETYCGETTQCFICTGHNDPDPYCELEEVEAPAPIPHTLRLDREKQIEEMASALVRANEEAGLDLGDWRLVDRWLNAAMYTQGQILAFGEPALARARAKLQVKSRVDDVACTVGVALAGVAAFFGWVGYAGEAQASILTAQACTAGGDLAMLLAGMGAAGIPMALIMWLRAAKVVAHCDEDRHGIFDYRRMRQ